MCINYEYKCNRETAVAEMPERSQILMKNREDFKFFAEKIGVLPLRATAILDRFMCISDQVVRLIRNSFLSEKTKLYAYHFREDKPFCEEIDSDNRKKLSYFDGGRNEENA